ncbi:MAG: hypothetical protein L0211_22875 [Planctomycetaceae bacterium]|nr:hypothetical protein [Planctomycetaceae bacterium]
MLRISSLTLRVGVAALLAIATAARGQDVAPQARSNEPAAPLAPTPVNKAQIEAALKLTTAEAGKYAFTLQDGPRSTPKLVADPVLRWSNPAVGEIHGNVFLWTVDERPAVIGSLFKWFTPHTHMSHEFHSLAEVPLVGRYQDRDVWTAGSAGVKFAPLPDAPPPASTAPGRLLAMKRLAKDFAATKTERDGAKQELRLLTQPIYRYASPEHKILDGALFVLVQGTDPEVFLLLEARGWAGDETWHFAPARMNSVGFVLRYQDKEVWSAEIMPWSDISSHAQPYTSFFIKMP